MAEEFVNIEVNGVPMKARKGEMIIRVTDANAVYVPRFCYHDKLSIAANCRMCLVEVEKAPKPLPACATPVAEGMKIFTQSQKATGAQRATMEFLLINHPLDCPICDQGGECELQDLAVGFGRDISRFAERKRVVADENLGPLVSTDMTRCIQCTRCIRFTQEIAGVQELGMVGRGEDSSVRAFVERTVDHELSGNIIDLCPVGALNSKPFRFSARAWEMIAHPLVSPHDGVGTNLFGHVLRGKLMRVVPRDNEAINETWIADRDRFSYEGVYSADRIGAPLVREGGSWTQVSWESALAVAVAGLRSHAGSLGALSSASATIEELYLLNRLSRGLGSANIDHRLRQRDFSDQGSDALYPNLGMRIAQVDHLNGLLIVGSNLRRELPLLAHRVRKAALAGAAVAFVNPAQFDYEFKVAAFLQSAPAAQAADLAAVLAAVAAKTGGAVPAHLTAATGDATVTAAHQAVAAALLSGPTRAVWLGALALRHPRYADLRALAGGIAQLAGASLAELAEGGNAAGAYLAGCVPHRDAGGKALSSIGRNAAEMLQTPLRAYILFGGVEPEADTLSPESIKALAAADLVVAITPYMTEQLKQIAHVVLPIGTFAETSGTYVNLEGLWQSFTAAARGHGESRPGWKVLRVLGTELGIERFEYQSSEEVRDELQRICAEGLPPVWVGSRSVSAAAGAASTVDVPMYQVDAVVRRAPSLQRTAEGRCAPATY
ncbi:MAG TPA: NADH-quinone oxidoreductase subunit NuoG [Steroidobacteraceae bacterium]|jgi:NADH-quinone oxidoreductase subunit G|nr:NADH-quinone oxidoreductase subunit NuoG [Steroidobacteraceae bacterium]